MKNVTNFLFYFFTLNQTNIKQATADLSKSPTPEKKRKLEEEALGDRQVSFSPTAGYRTSNDSSSPSTFNPSSSFRSPTTTKNENQTTPSSLASSVTLGQEDTEGEEEEEEEEDTRTEEDEDEDEVEVEVEEDDVSTDEEHRQLISSFNQRMSMNNKKKKEAGVKANKPIPMSLPYIQYEWKDVKRTDMTTIEIHLPAATVPSEIEMRIVTKKGKQAFELTHTLSPVLLDQRTFEELYSERPMGNDERDWLKDFASCTMAREVAIKKIASKHCHATDSKKEFPKLKMDIELPFFCEDIFDIENYHGTYTHAGTKFKTWKTTDEEGEEIMMQVLEVTLVSIVREKDELKIHTPNCCLVGHHILGMSIVGCFLILVLSRYPLSTVTPCKLRSLM